MAVVVLRNKERNAASWAGYFILQLGKLPLIPSAILALLLFTAIFANLIAPHSPTRGELTESLRPPVWLGARVIETKVVVDGRVTDILEHVSVQDALKKIDAGSARVAGGGEVAAGSNIEYLRQGGSWNHVLGTDRQGRDVLSRMIHGTRPSLMVSVVAILVAGSIGTAIGLAAGFKGGWVDSILMRLTDIVLSIPLVLIAVVIAAVAEPSLRNIIIIIGLLLWPRFARSVRGETLALKEQDFIARAVVSGSSNLSIVMKHILPNIVPSLLVISTLQVGYVILLEGSLSFLGVGVPPPQPAWGLMIAEGRGFLQTAWWNSLFPGIAMMLTVLSVNLFGDWLRDKLDPKLRQV
jgi:peptide/nickel transport system permease protein